MEGEWESETEGKEQTSDCQWAENATYCCW
jgi:hypothetical protein